MNKDRPNENLTVEKSKLDEFLNEFGAKVERLDTNIEELEVPDDGYDDPVINEFEEKENRDKPSKKIQIDDDYEEVEATTESLDTIAGYDPTDDIKALTGDAVDNLLEIGFGFAHNRIIYTEEELPHLQKLLEAQRIGINLLKTDDEFLKSLNDKERANLVWRIKQTLHYEEKILPTSNNQKLALGRVTQYYLGKIISSKVERASPMSVLLLLLIIITLQRAIFTFLVYFQAKTK